MSIDCVSLPSIIIVQVCRACLQPSGIKLRLIISWIYFFWRIPLDTLWILCRVELSFCKTKVIFRDFVPNIDLDFNRVENLAFLQASLCNVFTGPSGCLTCFFLFTGHPHCGKIHVTIELRKEWFIGHWITQIVNLEKNINNKTSKAERMYLVNCFPVSKSFHSSHRRGLWVCWQRVWCSRVSVVIHDVSPHFLCFVYRESSWVRKLGRHREVIIAKYRWKNKTSKCIYASWVFES